MKRRVISFMLTFAMLVALVPVTHVSGAEKEFVYELNSQAFALSTATYVSSSNSLSAGTLKYAGKNQSSNSNRNKDGGWVASSAVTTNAVIRSVNSLSYNYIKMAETNGDMSLMAAEIIYTQLLRICI